MTYAASYDDVCAAARRIASHAHHTPVMTCAAIDALAGRRLFFKCENLQKVGAFKFRGAYNAVSQLSDAEAARGVLTHSSGNHAQALALAARMRGIPAYIVMPSSAPTVKQEAVAGYGAEITLCEPTLQAREDTAATVQARTGATFIHPYNHPHIIAGAGTAALELMEDVPDLDAVVAPIGGGGLMSGTCLAVRGQSASVRLFAAEPVGADDAARSFAAGALIPQTAPDTIADGLLTSVGPLNWAILKEHLEAVLTVDDEAILAATRLMWSRMKLVVEPSGAVPLAVVLGDAFRQRPGLQRVGIIVSGGNAALDVLAPGLWG